MIPKHIGIIMDGNGRWAKRRGLPRKIGHLNGAKAIKSIVRHCNKIGVEVLSIFAFSTENWKRPQDEIDSLMKILKNYLDDMDLYIKDNIKVRFIGDLEKLDKDLIDKMKLTEEKCKSNTGMTFCIAVNYGGRNEIVKASQNIAYDIQNNKLKISDIDENLFESYLFTKDLPNVDLLIRPSGEYRISNFLIWQTAYAEFLFMENILWPDFKVRHLNRAIEEYQKRDRRFGALG